MRPGLDDVLILSGVLLAAIGLWHADPWLLLVEAGVLAFIAGIVVKR